MADNKREYYTTKDVCEMFSCRPQIVANTAHRERWRSVRAGGRIHYHVDDVNSYALARKRTRLLTALGRPRKFIERSSVYDGACPVCGAFAVFWQKNILAYIENPKAVYLCENGHNPGESK
jgi:hypothetical protein